MPTEVENTLIETTPRKYRVYSALAIWFGAHLLLNDFDNKENTFIQKILRQIVILLKQTNDTITDDSTKVKSWILTSEQKSIETVIGRALIMSLVNTKADEDTDIIKTFADKLNINASWPGFLTTQKYSPTNVDESMPPLNLYGETPLFGDPKILGVYISAETKKMLEEKYSITLPVSENPKLLLFERFKLFLKSIQAFFSTSEEKHPLKPNSNMTELPEKNIPPEPINSNNETTKPLSKKRKKVVVLESESDSEPDNLPPLVDSDEKPEPVSSLIQPDPTKKIMPSSTTHSAIEELNLPAAESESPKMQPEEDLPPLVSVKPALSDTPQKPPLTLPEKVARDILWSLVHKILNESNSSLQTTTHGKIEKVLNQLSPDEKKHLSDDGLSKIVETKSNTETKNFVAELKDAPLEKLKKYEPLYQRRKNYYDLFFNKSPIPEQTFKNTVYVEKRTPKPDQNINTENFYKIFGNAEISQAQLIKTAEALKYEYSTETINGSTYVTIKGLDGDEKINAFFRKFQETLGKNANHFIEHGDATKVTTPANR